MSGSAMNEAGSIGFRLQMIGAAVFQREATQADRAITGIATAATGAARAVGPLTQAQDAAAVSNRSAAQAAREAAAEVERLRRESEEAAKTIGVAAVGIGAAFATVAGLTIATYAEFDEASSKTAAATMATREQQDLLKASAIEQGAASVYSAREAADAQTELAKAGVSVNDILAGGLAGSLALAAAGELAVARAAEIAATTLTVFALKGDQAGHVADLLAAGAGKAQGSVDDLALGLDYVGVTFSRLNIPLEDTVGTLALLASNGLLGEKAGTGLRSVMSSLTSPVAKASEVMKQYNIDVFDGAGKFIGMAASAEQLKNGLFELDEETRSAALGAIFGAEAATAAGILYSSGAKGVEEWTENVNDQGYAAEQAAMKTDNLNGDLERLGGSMDSALIKTGSTANDTMREMVQLITGLVDWYGQLDAGAQGTALAIGVGTAAVLLFGGTALLVVPKIVEFRAALTSLNTGMRGTAVAGGVVGIALTAAVAMLGVLAAQSANARESAEAFNATLDDQTGALTKNTRASIVKQLQDKGLFDFGKKAGFSQRELTDAVFQGGAELDKVNEKFGDLNSITNLWGDTNAFAAGNAKQSLKEITEGLDMSQEAWENETAAAETSATATGGATVQTEALTAATEEATEARKDYLASLAEQDAAFIDLAGGYDSIIAKNTEAAEATAAATEDSGDSWETYYDGFTVGLDNYLAQLQEQVDAQNNWESNMILLSGKVSQGVLDELARMGPEGAPLVADLVNASGEQLGLAETLFAEKGEAATGAFALKLTESQAVIAAAGAQLGQATANEIAGKLASGTATVEQIMAEYKLRVESVVPALSITTSQAQANLDAFIAGNGGRTIMVGASVGTTTHVANGNGGGGMTFADGGVVSYYADGGLSERHVAQVEKAGAMRVWAEPETGGEAYIPLATAKRGRSSAILADVAGKFGYQLVPAGGAQSYAGGAVVGGRDVPPSGPAWTGDIVIQGHTGDDSHLAKIVRYELQDLFRQMNIYG